MDGNFQVLAMGLIIIAALAVMSGLILDTVTRGRWEAKRMAYLAIPGVQHLDDGQYPDGLCAPATGTTHDFPAQGERRALHSL